MLVSAPRRNAIISLIADHFSVMTERHTKGVFFVVKVSLVLRLWQQKWSNLLQALSYFRAPNHPKTTRDCERTKTVATHTFVHSTRAFVLVYFLCVCACARAWMMRTYFVAVCGCVSAHTGLDWANGKAHAFSWISMWQLHALLCIALTGTRQAHTIQYIPYVHTIFAYYRMRAHIFCACTFALLERNRKKQNNTTTKSVLLTHLRYARYMRSLPGPVFVSAQCKSVENGRTNTVISNKSDIASALRTPRSVCNYLAKLFFLFFSYAETVFARMWTIYYV